MAAAVALSPVRPQTLPGALGVATVSEHPVHLFRDGAALVPSRSVAGREYLVTCLSGVDPLLVAPVPRELQCECAAHTYRGRCAHQGMVADAWAAYHRWLAAERAAQRAAAYAEYWNGFALDPLPADVRRWDDLGYV